MVSLFKTQNCRRPRLYVREWFLVTVQLYCPSPSLDSMGSSFFQSSHSVSLHGRLLVSMVEMQSILLPLLTSIVCQALSAFLLPLRLDTKRRRVPLLVCPLVQVCDQHRVSTRRYAVLNAGLTLTRFPGQWRSPGSTRLPKAYG